jgi:hypothetical protein
MSENKDWEAHKLLIMQDVKELKEGQKEVREDVSKIRTQVTILQVKSLFITAISSIVMSGVVAYLVGVLSK